jgi:hypothetical protein
MQSALASSANVIDNYFSCNWFVANPRNAKILEKISVLAYLPTKGPRELILPGEVVGWSGRHLDAARRSDGGSTVS